MFRRLFMLALGAPLLSSCLDYDALSRGPDASDPTCPPASRFCEPFEGATLDLSRWVPFQHNTEVMVDGTRPRRGSGSLHIHSLGSMMNDPVRGTIQAPFGGDGQLFVRAWFYTSQTPVQQEFFAAHQNPPGPMDPNLSLYGNNGALSTWNSVAAPTAITPSTTTIMPNRWVCLEWEIDHQAPQRMNAWVDGVAVPELATVAPTEPNPPISILLAGFEDFDVSAKPVLDVWIDDVVVATAHIGCP